MIQSLLFFILGALCATFLAVMLMPVLWRRALKLTRMRMEASMPFSLAEMQADRDQMRARFAMETRRLEMIVKALRERGYEQAIEIERGRMELKRLAGGAEVRARTPDWYGKPDRGGRNTGDPAVQPAGKSAPMAKTDDENEEMIAALKTDCDRLEAQLTGSPAAEDKGEFSDTKAVNRENARLREEIGDLAARMVVMTMAVEGADSAIKKALAEPESPKAASGKGIVSLASRVRSLRNTICGTAPSATVIENDPGYKSLSQYS